MIRVSVVAAIMTTAAAAASTQNPLRQPSGRHDPAPASGPSAMPAPTAAPQTPVAWVRAGPAGNARPIEPRPAASTPPPATP